MGMEQDGLCPGIGSGRLAAARKILLLFLPQHEAGGKYEYAIDDTAYFSIWLSQSDIRIYIDAENADVEPFDKDGITGYFFKKEDLNYVCFERDGCSFSVYGLLDMDELIKIAAGITKE